MIDAPILEIICIWIAALSATGAVAIVVAIAAGVSHTTPLLELQCERDQINHCPQDDEGNEHGDPYLEYGKAEVEMILS